MQDLTIGLKAGPLPGIREKPGEGEDRDKFELI